NDFSCALRTDTTVYCWGQNPQHELGPTTITTRSYAEADYPVAVGISGARQISSGGDHTCAAMSDGTLRCWGNDQYGELGNGTVTGNGIGTPVTVFGIDDATAVAAGASSSCALLVGGSIKCWGANNAGQLGNGTTV